MIMEKFLAGVFDTLANIHYKDLHFDVRKDGNNVFKPLADKDGMVLMVSANT